MEARNNKFIEKLFRSLCLIRRVEEEIAEIYPTDKIKSPVHLSIGQEAVSVGACQALQANDIVFGSYRGHAMYLAKGGSLKKMISELYGKVTGCAKGKGGSMHLIDPEKGVMGTSAIVGTTIPISVGFAYGLKHKQADSIVVSFFGDGAVDEGAFHESLNFAALKGLPILFFCENNFYAIHSHHLRRHLLDNIWERAKSYGIPSERIEDGDIIDVYETTKACTDRIRHGKGPIFIECITSRWKEHVGPGDDFHMGYRSEKEVLEWKDKDQLKKLKQLLDPNLVNSIEKEVEERIKEAFEFAERSPFPDADALLENLFWEQ
jgi:TPP-dependent pyruvate/acetoin dehydrogenase alpha subunit